ncbi:MAG: hypothetical protein NTU78_16370 [Alphaproteobacteria bacterium]|nr:hypothetical protein [Alphaproteobacteria bacterium]
MTASSPRIETLTVPLRPPSQVMRLARRGSFFATRLSFMRVLVRELKAGQWRFDRPVWDLDDDGFGTAVYRVTGRGRAYSLVAFSQFLAPEDRNDRVIAQAWDSTFVLYDGTPSADEIERLHGNAPRQEAGRYGPHDLVLCRANKSMRLFEHIARRLAQGLQPDAEQILQVGYLMRTTAVYGNGKFGIADRFRIADRPELAGPFQAEMLAVYLVRLFTLDLVEHVAHRRAPDTAVQLVQRFRRFLGIGNATGLGMAPFLMTHPLLIANWMEARETALARQRMADSYDHEKFAVLLSRARRHVAQWRVDDARQTTRIVELERDLEALARQSGALSTPDQIYRWGEGHLGLEAQELIVSLLIELDPERVDDLATRMAAEESCSVDGAMRVDELIRAIETDYDWALKIDCGDPRQRRLFWYVSEEKLEPRLGDRTAEPGAELERPFAVAHDIQAALADLRQADAQDCTAAFLMRHPEHRHIIRRAQLVRRHPYAEIRDNLVAKTCLPIDILRCKLSFFGASKFDPKSDLWTRITMYQGAPLPEDLGRADADDWCFPAL